MTEELLAAALLLGAEQSTSTDATSTQGKHPAALAVVANKLALFKSAETDVLQSTIEAS